MLKRIIIIITAIAMYCCSAEDEASQGVQDGEVRVVFDASFQTGDVVYDEQLEPMTRAGGDIGLAMHKQYHVLILKETGNKYVVERYDKADFPTANSNIHHIYLPKDDPSLSFDLCLRPGKYKMLAVFNSFGVTWNTDLKNGYVVCDDAEHPENSTVKAPWMIKHWKSVYVLDNGLNAINGEIFIAEKNFEVKKGQYLDTPETQQVDIAAKRKVGKLRLLLSDRQADDGENFTISALTSVKYNLQIDQASSVGKVFPLGIDAMGEYYYGNAQDQPFSSFDTYTYVGGGSEDEWRTLPDGSMTGKYVGSNVDNLTNSMTIYHFVNPDSTLTCNVTAIDLKSAFDYAVADGSVGTVTLKHNSIDGIIYKRLTGNKFTVETDPLYRDDWSRFPADFEWNYDTYLP